MFLRLGFHWARVWTQKCLEDEAQAWSFRGLSPQAGRQAAQVFINNLKRHGFGILVSTHPSRKYASVLPWALPPETPQQYADYELHLKQLFERFGDRIDYWEVGNEPNPPLVTPHNYAKTVGTTVRVLRGLDPNAKIVSLAGAADGQRAWIERAIEHGALEGVDGISFHYGGQTGADTVDRYRQWQQWAARRKGRPLDVWDSEENIRGPSIYPIRVQSPTGLADVGHGAAYPALFCRDAKSYLCNSAMNIRTIVFSLEYTMINSGYERGFWERGGALRPAAAASFLAAQRIQTMHGGGFYRSRDGLFGAMLRDHEQSVLIVWSEKYTGTCQVKTYADPFDLHDLTPRPIEELSDIPDFYRDVAPLKVRPPKGTTVLDTMGVPAERDGGQVTVDIYPTYLIVPTADEPALLRSLGAEQVLEPLAAWH